MKIISRADAKVQNLKHYYTGKPCKHGHDSERYVGSQGACCECVKSRVRNYSKLNPEKKKESDRKYYVENIDEIKKQAKNYREENRDEIRIKARAYSKSDECKEACRKYRLENRDKINAQKMTYYHADRDKHLEQRRTSYQKHKKKRNAESAEYRMKNKDKINEYFVNRRKTDLKFKMSTYMRNMLNRVLNRSYNDKTNNTVQMLGYTCDELISHIEILFTDGMTWDNYGEWHIDHIVPLSVLIDNGLTNPSDVNALPNLQPLWAIDNLTKGAKI